jgi:hypothetical protein
MFHDNTAGQEFLGEEKFFDGARQTGFDALAVGDDKWIFHGILNMQILFRVPFMFNVAHKQGAVERNCSFGKFGLVGKKTGVDVLHFERFDFPGKSFEADAVEPHAGFGGGITKRAGFKKA